MDQDMTEAICNGMISELNEMKRRIDPRLKPEAVRGLFTDIERTVDHALLMIDQMKYPLRKKNCSPVQKAAEKGFNS